MSVKSEIREDLERHVRRLDVPFAVVQAGSDANWEAAGQKPNLDLLPEESRSEVGRLLAAAGFTELVRLAFYYVSRVPFPVPDEATTASMLRERFSEVEREAGVQVHSVCINDGLPDPVNARSRLVTARTGCALHDIMALRPTFERDWSLPTFRTATLPGVSPRDGSTCRLVIFHHRPETIRDALRGLLDETGFVPDFLGRCDPPLGETVARMSYVQRGDDSSCIETKVHDDGVGYTRRTCELVVTPGFTWTAIAHGPSLGGAIMNAFELDRQLPSPDARRWPAPGPEFPKNWLVRALSDDMPRYPKEPIEYPRGAESLEHDRWLCWTWQCGRWSWPEIDEAAKKRRVPIRSKKGSRPESDRTRTYRERAEAYATWIGQALRSGR